MWKNLYEEGATGSEGGIILADEEYEGTCRITLEKCERYHAVTCGVYGSMVHTAFFSEAEACDKYESMKNELQDFIDKNLDEDARYEFYDYFTRKY